MELTESCTSFLLDIGGDNARTIVKSIRIDNLLDNECFASVFQQSDVSIDHDAIVNFKKSPVKGVRHCVMCGKAHGQLCEIPTQNKDVCKVCDSSMWFLKDIQTVVKFCKGILIYNVIISYTSFKKLIIHI
jgi:hypothetical protein